MHVQRFDDPEGFASTVQTFLTQREAEHNLMLGILHQIITASDSYEAYYLATVEENGEIIAAALRTLPLNLILSHTDDPASLEAIADDLYQTYPTLSGVMASKLVAEQFAKFWMAKTGHSGHRKSSQIIWKLTEVVPVLGVTGHMRPATLQDTDLACDWLQMMMPDADSAYVYELVERHFDDPDRAMFLWEVDDKPVSLATYAGRTPHGRRIETVYTPPEHRRNGYASALVAELSQKLLAQGLQFCFLYTYRDNVAAKRVYESIGYMPVCDSEVWVFQD